jgi:hypothetical protein
MIWARWMCFSGRLRSSMIGHQPGAIIRADDDAKLLSHTRKHVPALL